VAYRANIEIGVIGTDKLRSLRRDLDGLNNKLKEIDENAEIFEAPIRSIASFSRALQTAQQNLSLVELATDDEAKAIKDYVTALGASNDAVARQNQLIQQEVTLRNKAKKSIETRRKRDEFLAGPGRTIGAEKSAQRAAKESARRQREFKEIEGYNRSIFKIEQGFNKKIRDYEIDTLLKTFKLEENLQDRAFRNALDLDKKEGAAFDAELQRRVQATRAADRAASEARRLTGQSSPIDGAVNIPGSPAAKRRTANRQAITRGAGIGLATANIPGSNIAQAAAIGAGFGGPKGAAIAASVAAVSQAISGLVRLGPEVAKTEAQLSKLNIALRGILGSKSEEGFKAIDRAARDFNQPILDATRNFTQLSAAATANGNSVKQTETLYRALSAATKATGGDAQDLSGVLRAATQVISKGVVRSEELRGQIGDRLPGAFQLFAQATNRSAEELQKALEQGEVSADEFVTTFSDFILKKFEPAALRIGDSPAEAGARLTKALEDANRAAGPLLLSLGAKFQDFAKDAIEAVTPLLNQLNKFFKLDRAGKNQTLADIRKNKIPELTERTANLKKGDPRDLIRDPNANIFSGLLFGDSVTTRGIALQEAQKELKSLQGREAQLTQELFPTGGLDPLKPGPETEDLKGAPRAPKLPTSKGFQLQQQISQELLKQFDIKTKYMQLNMSESEALDFQNTRLRERLQREENLLEFQRQQALATSKYAADAALINELFNTRLVTLRGQVEAQIQQNLASKEQLAIQEKITQLRRQEELEGLERGLRRDIADVERRTASPFGGDEAERADLLIKQTRRYEDVINGLTASIKEQEELQTSKDEKVREAATKEIAQLEEKIALNEILLPVLNQVEQAELRQNQLMEKYGFIANEAATAMSSAVQSIVTGTGSVEEAFSNMFANIGKAFIDMATQMMAQQAFMLILKALGGGGSSPLGSGMGKLFNFGGGGGMFSPGGSDSTFGLSFAGGGFTGNGPRSGGLDGQGGFLSLLHPQETVIDHTKSRDAMSFYGGGGGTPAYSPNIQATTMPDGMQYVTVEQMNSTVQAGMKVAANQGAAGGQSRTMNALRNSRSQRSKIGLGR